MDQNNQNFFELQVDHVASSYLMETAKWTRFLAIVWFILCGLMVLFAIGMGSIIAGEFQRAFGGAGAFGGIFVTVFYIFIAVIQLIPNIFRYKFAIKMLRAIRGNDTIMLNESFNHLRTYTKYWGIFTIIVMGLYAIGILFAGLGMLLSR